MTTSSVAQPAREPSEDREERQCAECFGSGDVGLDVLYDPVSGELVQEAYDCPTCKGTGTVHVYLYPNVGQGR